MAQTTSKFRVIKDSSIYNNTKCSSYGDDVLMVDTSGGIYLGNETSTPDLIAASPNGIYPNMTVGKATTADTANRANTAATAATAVNISEAPILAATEDEQITVKVGNKTSNALTVPYAQRADFATDLSGRVEATPEVFTYRPSAGDKSIKDNNAFIRRVKGNSVVWNQRCDFTNGVFTFGESSGIKDAEGYTITTNESNTTATIFQFNSPIPFYSHKWLAIATIKSPITVNIKGMSTQGFVPNTKCDIYSFYQSTEGNWYWGLSTASVGTISEIKVYNYLLFDLTQMFGAGNEPNTIEEFRALYPDSYYPYNTGELRNLNCYGIKTVGFNQWDGKVEVGYIDDTTGNATANQNYLHTDFIRVIPNQEYYINTEQTNSRWGAWYDANKNYIAGILNYDQVYTAPANAAYVRLTIKSADSGNPDTFCINLHHTGYRDGEYEPYKEVTHLLPLSQITNGEPLRKAGSVYDEINETEYIKRVGVVDLGSYDWYETPNGTFNTVVSIPDIKAVELESNYTCKKYIGVSNPSTIYDGTADNLTISTNGAGRIYIKDDAYKTGTAYAAVTALKAALSGVLLHYELAEPIVTPIEIPIDFNYYIEDFGTEEALLTEDSAPFSADIVYQFNAVDTIRQNNRNIKKLMDDFIYWELY